MPIKMPRVYEGDRDYIFVNYAHADRDVVLPIIAALGNEGYRVWYDEGIRLVTDYPDYLVDRVYGCTCLVMFVSRASLKSNWCRQEVNYALDLNKKVLLIYIEDIELTRGLQMRVGYKQALFWFKHDSDEAFYEELFTVRQLDLCLTDEGRRRRGAKPRPVETEMNGGLPCAPKARAIGNTPLLDDFPILHKLLVNDEGVESSEAYGKTVFAVYPSAGLRSDL